MDSYGHPSWPIAFALLITLAGTTVYAEPVDAQAAPKFRFDLPANPFPVTVLEFYHQSARRGEVLYSVNPDESLRAIKTHPVHGTYSMEEAMRIMLLGTPLVYTLDQSDGKFLVRLIPPTAAGTHGQSAPISFSHHLAMTEVDKTLDQVVVTGTLLHGVTDVTAPLVYVTRKELSQASYATVQDALYALPINSLNGPREDLFANHNNQYGAGVNLRGLGTGATLVLINGRRQPLSGLNGDFVDVSTIPWTAVERIEVLPEGASALYGSDAIAGVVNIIMRDDMQGGETQTRFGTAAGGRAEKLVSQLLGAHWSSGKVLIAYQYSDATDLAAAHLAYAADANKTAFGGGDYRTYYSNPGNILDPRTLAPTYAIPGGQSGIGLSSGALSRSINLANQFAHRDLFPERRSHLVYLALSQKIGDHVELFANSRLGTRDVLREVGGAMQTLAVPKQNPYFVDPYGESSRVLVAYNFLPDLGPATFAAGTSTYTGDIGAKWAFADNWHATITETYGRETLASDEYNVPDQSAVDAALAGTTLETALNPFGDGSYTNSAVLASIRRDFRLRAVSAIEVTTAIIDGPVFRVPAGAAQLAVGLERRAETLGHDVPDPTDPAEKTIYQTYGRHVSSAFIELAIPLQGDPDKPAAVPRLELTLAGRYEDYSDFGHTFNPTARLRWIPVHWLKLRASWARSFRAPQLDDLHDTSQNASFLTVIPDPDSPTGRSLILGRQGSNPNLREETATTWNVGFDLASTQGLKFSLSYYSINYNGRIDTPASDDPLNILVHQSEWAPVITRNPMAAQITAICNSSEFQGSLTDCLSSSPAAIVDLRLANLASTKVRGLDLDAHQTFDSVLGRFALGINSNYVLHFDQAVTSTSPSQDVLDTVGNPVGLRLRATADWTQHRSNQPGWGAALALVYTGAYRNPASSHVPRVDAWTTVDCQLSYRTATGHNWWNGMEIAANAVNAGNQSPPFVDIVYGYDAQNVQPLGRVISLFASKSW